MGENVFIENVFFAFVGAAMAALGIVKCRKYGWRWLLCSVVGVAVLLAMIYDWGELTYADSLLWLLCIVNFGIWFAVKPLKFGWLPLIPLIPIISALLVIVWDPLWWIGVIGGMAVNAICGYAFNEYTKFKTGLYDFKNEDI